MKKLLLLFLLCNACSAGEPIPTPSVGPGTENQPVAPIPQKTQWLIITSSDTAQPPGLNPATTYFISKNRVILRQLPDGSTMISFEP